MVEVERLKKGTESRISTLLALGEVAAINLADKDDYPDEHGGHTNETGQETLDEVDD